jgi:hypothetical protein
MGTLFPHQTLTTVQGKPTPQALQRLKKELIANAMSVHSTRGGGLHGHLALILSDYDYELISGQPFDHPAHPGPAPAHAPNATYVQIYSTDRAYNRALHEFETYNNTKNSLLALILAAVESDYYTMLNDPFFGYASVTPRELFNHLHDTYGTISTKDLEKNREVLQKPPPPAPTTTDSAVRIDNVIDMYYCWTHGLGRNRKHTSKSCKNPARGHQYNATILDIKGGCRTIQMEPLWRRDKAKQPEQ